jgi:hypothetical protein
MMSTRAMLRFGAGVVLCSYASTGNALTINLKNLGGVTQGSQVEAGFMAAAGFWESMLGNDVTLDINMGFSALTSKTTISQSTVKQYTVSATAVEDQLRANAVSALDATVIGNLPTLTNGAFKMIMPGYNYPTTKQGVNTNVKIYDADATFDNKNLNVTTANMKALGLNGPGGPDASITFNSTLAYDFDPSDGITAGTLDFIGVAIHEIGHALGFTSGVDYIDYYGSKGPGKASWINLNTIQVGTVLDMFRYSNDPTNLVGGTGAVLDWTPGTASYFSVDGGHTAYGATPSLAGTMTGGAYFSTGLYSGDGRQASHWKDSLGLGMMDPTLGYSQLGIVSANDLAAFDAIGWNLGIDIANSANLLIPSSGDYAYTGEVYYNAVPEPASWAMMIAGFGMVGTAVRRRRRAMFAAA